jgi:hypothetical protein
VKQVTGSKGDHEYTVDLVCAECESPIKIITPSKGTTKTGSPVCPECIELYYVACAGCVLLIPRDESLTRNDLILCADCYAKPPSDSTDVGLLENPESLISEYIALHAEEKRIKTRMDELKDALKEVAAVQQRVSNAVTLRAEDGAVKCSYRSSIKCNQEVVESLAERMDEQEFEELFERKVSYSPHKERVHEFLNSADNEHSETRELLRAAIIETETATLTVVINRRE